MLNTINPSLNLRNLKDIFSLLRDYCCFKIKVASFLMMPPK